MWIGGIRIPVSRPGSTPNPGKLMEALSMKKKLTQERLKEVLHYDPDTGIFIWINTKANRLNNGDVAGYKEPSGYIQIRVYGVLYKAHRLAWLYIYGYFPEHGLDHIDRIPCHNCIDNLREESQSCNMRNTGNNKNNTSGIKGVSFDSRKNKWCAYIMINYIKKSLGIYESFENAVCARLAGEQCLNWSGCDSSSPAFIYVNKNIIIRRNKNEA